MDSPSTPWWKRIISIEPDPVLPPSARESCDYQGYEFGARDYPDSVCIEGYLWDADSGHAADGEDGWVYTNGGDIACPACNRRGFLQHAREDWFEIAYNNMRAGGPIFQRGPNGYRFACWRAQLSGAVCFLWDRVRG